MPMHARVCLMVLPCVVILGLGYCARPGVAREYDQLPAKSTTVQQIRQCADDGGDAVFRTNAQGRVYIGCRVGPAHGLRPR